MPPELCIKYNQRNSLVGLWQHSVIDTTTVIKPDDVHVDGLLYNVVMARQPIFPPQAA